VDGDSLLCGAGIGAGTVICWAVMRRIVPWLRMLEDDLRSVIGPLSLRAALLLAILSGVAEETFFRGALQPEVGLVFASFYFAALHVPFRLVYVIWTAFAFGMGMVLGWLFNSTGNILGPMLAHMLINAVNLRRITRPEPRPRGR
jgi:membrane protease YdiL (CAAX protease family)